MYQNSLKKSLLLLKDVFARQKQVFAAYHNNCLLQRSFQKQNRLAIALETPL